MAASRLILSMYSVFGDESHDADRVRVFAVGGLFGDDNEWEEAKAAWSARTGSIIFHATDCDSDNDEFANFSHRENKRLYKDLTKILASSRLFGFGASVSLPDYNRVFADKLDYTPYFLCFSEVICHFARQSHLSIPRDLVKYTFAHNNRVEHDAASVYEYSLILREWPYHKYLYPGELAFGFRTNPCVQMADLVAHETMKHWDNQFGPVWRMTRGSFRALQSTGRFRYHFFGGDYFEDLVERSDRIASSRSLKQPYQSWLNEHSLSDTVSARIKYQFFIDQIDRQGGQRPSTLEGPAPVPQ